jgi:hypothetical protein
VELTQEQRGSIRAMARDRAGIDRRLIEIDAEVQHLMDERDELKARRVSNKEIAASLGCSETTVHYVIHGRL